MGLEVLTKEDLREFRAQLIEDFKKVIAEIKEPQTGIENGYKTSDVRKILGCCTNKLTALRISRQLRTKKIGGTVYYNKDDIKRLVDEGY